MDGAPDKFIHGSTTLKSIVGEEGGRRISGSRHVARSRNKTGLIAVVNSHRLRVMVVPFPIRRNVTFG